MQINRPSNCRQADVQSVASNTCGDDLARLLNYVGIRHFSSVEKDAISNAPEAIIASHCEYRDLILLPLG